MYPKYRILCMPNEHFSRLAYKLVLSQGAQDMLNVLQVLYQGDLDKDEDFVQI
jgi:hypothetical protein